MNTFLISLLGLLGLLFLWGVVSPRTQWHVMIGWSRSDSRSSEPGSVAYATSRVLSLVGLIVISAMSLGWLVGAIAVSRPGTERAPGMTEMVWGEPRSYVVDRVFTSLAAPPDGLVPQAISGYQLVQGPSKTPNYLFTAGKIREAGQANQPGFLGVVPLPGTVALDTADLVLHVRGDDRCIPQQVVVAVVEGGVQLGVYFGQPTPAEAENATDVANCDPDPPLGRTRGYLIPVDLIDDLDGAAVQSLDGLAIAEVPSP